MTTASGLVIDARRTRDPGPLVPFTIIGSRSMDKGHAKEVHAYPQSCEERFEALSILFDFPPIARRFALAAPDLDFASVTERPAPRRLASIEKLGGH